MVARRNIYKGVYMQRGGGIGTAVSTIFRMLVPFLKRNAHTVLKSQPVKRAIRVAKRSAVKTAGQAAKDLLSGKNPKEGAKLNLREAQAKVEQALIPRSNKVNKKKKSAKRVSRIGPKPLL